MTERIEIIRARLETAFDPESLIITDDSHLHVGHAGAKDGRGHFSVEIVSAMFDNTRAVECHRMIYAALGELMTTDIHALRIIARGTLAKHPSNQGT